MAIKGRWLLITGDRFVAVPLYYAPENAEQDQIDVKWLGKKTNFPTCQRRGRNLIIVNKSIKETENLICLAQDRILFHLWAPKLVFSLVTIATCENTTFGVHSMK